MPILLQTPLHGGGNRPEDGGGEGCEFRAEGFGALAFPTLLHGWMIFPLCHVLLESIRALSVPVNSAQFLACSRRSIDA